VVARTKMTCAGGSSRVFQQGVERIVRELMGLVDHVHLVLAHRGGEPDLLAQVAHLVDAAVARRVDLDEVQVAAVADRHAALARVTGVAVLRFRAVHGLRDDPGDRGLPDPPRAR